jgi:prevent-host-death family protein
MKSWKVAEARARFSELVESGAQEITRHGKRTVVVVSATEWSGVRRCSSVDSSPVPRVPARPVWCLCSPFPTRARIFDVWSALLSAEGA